MVIYMVYELMSSRNCSFHYIHKYRCQLILMTPHYLENHICYMTKLWDWVWLPDNIWPVIPWAICSSQLYWPPFCATCWLSYLSSHISRQVLTKITAKRCKWFYSIYHNRQIIRFSLAQTIIRAADLGPTSKLTNMNFIILLHVLYITCIVLIDMVTFTESTYTQKRKLGWKRIVTAFNIQHKKK